MEPIYALFLQAMKAAMQDTAVDWGDEVGAEEILRLMEVAQEHHVLPMLFEAVYATPGAQALSPTEFAYFKRATVQSVTAQTIKTQEFLELYRHLRSKGLTPLVVKGLVCRNLYPKPDYRFSGDEDVLCGESSFAACHAALLDFGMTASSPDLDSYEVPYRKKNSALYIECHKTLFAKESDVFGDYNQLFVHAFDNAVELIVQNQTVYTLDYTDHMLYLILHAFKHFLHSGFGIRQVSDIVLFANAYGQHVDWERVMDICRRCRTDRFAAALFRIGEEYLVFSPRQACLPQFWQDITVDEKPLLADLLYGGIYGSSELSRVHSSNMTLNAAAASKKGKKAKKHLLRTIFPSVGSLSGRYPYLRRMPFLLPIAWICRIFGYIRERFTEPNNAASDVIRIGSRRIELLREYDIID